MSDFDTRRVGEIAVLEETIIALQKQVAEYKADAELWTPKVSSELGVGLDQSRVTMSFGGRTMAATMPTSWLLAVDLTSGTTAVIENLCSSLVSHQLRSVIEPELQKLMMNAKAVSGAGKW